MLRFKMSKSPITVQQWVESLPPPHTTSSFYSSPLRNTRRFIPREISLQSDDASSHCSSVESVLELRKPDPEAVLLGLGFGPPKGTNLVSKIPSRFLQPSKVELFPTCHTFIFTVCCSCWRKLILINFWNNMVTLNVLISSKFDYLISGCIIVYFYSSAPPSPARSLSKSC